MVIDDVAEDEVYCRHPTPALYGFRSYISVPIILPDGSVFGTLCAIDPKPACLKDSETLGMFTVFSELIAFHLSANAKLASTQAVLLDERRTAQLREQFIAVLGHDLRNPVAAIRASAELLPRTPLDERASRLVTVIQESVTRISGLIDDVMDFARGQRGGGLVLERASDGPLGPTLREVIAELQTVSRIG